MENYTPLRDYFLIGDLYSAALISRQGSIDWLCLPDFDSPSIFARILDTEKGGFFSIEAPGYLTDASYRKDTAIVDTVFSRNEMSFIVTDCMSPQPLEVSKNHTLARIVKSRRGSHNVTFHFNPAPDYGRQTPDVVVSGATLTCRLNGDTLTVFPPENAEIKDAEKGFLISFDIAEGEEKAVLLEYAENGENPERPDGLALAKETEAFWKSWVSQGSYFPFCRECLVRSAITLKLMQFYPTGALIAAPTTSLPEAVGGRRNWDYRYVWIRDATFTLYSLIVLGFKEEAEKFFDYIENILDWEDEEDIELMYTIHGKRLAGEERLDNLEGYRGSKPVRVGNSAASQFQLDVFGALIDAFYFAITRGIEISEGKKKILLRLARSIENNWKKKDNGIWEVRRDPQHYTYSKVMCYVGIDRLLRLRDIISLTEDQVEHYDSLRNEIRDWIFKHCLDENGERLWQYPGAEGQDATNFLFVLLQFLDVNDPLTKKILENTHRELSWNDILLYRYRTDDGLAGEEGAFFLCSFWMASAYALIGDIPHADELFRKAEEYLNRQSLMPEEIETKTGEYLGNLPQAFSHMGYIMSAYYINRYSDDTETRRLVDRVVMKPSPKKQGTAANSRGIYAFIHRREKVPVRKPLPKE